MMINEITGIIVDKCYKIHVGLGPGLLESVYEEILDYELEREGLSVVRQQIVPVEWQKARMDIAFRADLIVKNSVLIEIKSVAVIAPVHLKQILTYLKLTGLKIGLLVNFNEAFLKDGIKRVVNKL